MNVFTTLAQYSRQTIMLTDAEAEAVALNLFVVFFPAIIVAALIGYIISGIFIGRIFRKAGLAQWPAWVPFYNMWKFFEIGGQYGALSILMYLPFIQIAGIVIYLIAAYHIGLKLEKPGIFVLLAIFIPYVWMIWLAIDESKWNDKASSAHSLAKGPLAVTTAYKA